MGDKGVVMRKIIIDTDTGSDDAVAIMMCLREPSVKAVPWVSHVCTEHNETYGQVIFYDGGMLAGTGPGFDAGYYGKKKPNCTVICEITTPFINNAWKRS